jgi:carbon monoxide dehydrogenase subunit G
MATGKAEATIDASPDVVWALVGQFGDLHEWMPGIESCELDGDVRKLQTMGMEIHEQLKERDESARRIAYSIVKMPIPIEHHLATITVTEEGDGSRLTWEYEIVPDEMAGAMGPVYEGSVQAVKERFAGSGG